MPLRPLVVGDAGRRRGKGRKALAFWGSDRLPFPGGFDTETSRSSLRGLSAGRHCSRQAEVKPAGMAARGQVLLRVPLVVPWTRSGGWEMLSDGCRNRTQRPLCLVAAPSAEVTAEVLRSKVMNCT